MQSIAAAVAAIVSVAAAYQSWRHSDPGHLGRVESQAWRNTHQIQQLKDRILAIEDGSPSPWRPGRR
ncbi:hypothetical protein [Crateriforma conspicua]|uniref:hypothetical protein n=1 Tax=Crateriforma conspicua TaxID=2527996 RepID=UPI0011B3829F|nr:hypothetical protein [Crateriforma conspicua]